MDDFQHGRLAGGLSVATSPRAVSDHRKASIGRDVEGDAEAVVTTWTEGATNADAAGTKSERCANDCAGLRGHLSETTHKGSSPLLFSNPGRPLIERNTLCT